MARRFPMPRPAPEIRMDFSLKDRTGHNTHPDPSREAGCGGGGVSTGRLFLVEQLVGAGEKLVGRFALFVFCDADGQADAHADRLRAVL